MREKKKSSWITNGAFPIFHEWLSRRDEIIIPHERRSREWGIIISLQLLSQEWKIGNVPWVMSEEFYPSLFLSRPELTFPYKKENFNIWQTKLNTKLNSNFYFLISIEKKCVSKLLIVYSRSDKSKGWLKVFIELQFWRIITIQPNKYKADLWCSLFYQFYQSLTMSKSMLWRVRMGSSWNVEFIGE